MASDAPLPPLRQPIAAGFDLLRYPPGAPYPLRVETPFPLPNWHPRQPDTLTRSELPGTALQIDDHWYEIVHMEAAPQPPRMAYDLRPWQDHHILRSVFELTPDLCQNEIAKKKQRERREQMAPIFTLLSPFLGLLPAEEQNRLELEWGPPAGRNTLISASIMLSGGIMLVLIAFASFAGMSFGRLQWLADAALSYLPLIFILITESLLRMISGFNDEPMGSLPIAIPFAAYHAVRNALHPEARRRAAVERSLRQARDPDVPADAVRIVEEGEHDLEIVSHLPKDHWTMNVTGIAYEEELYVLVDRETSGEGSAMRHRFLLTKVETGTTFPTYAEYHPREAAEILRQQRRVKAAAWVETFALLWGFLDGETQEHLAGAYDIRPWRITPWALILSAVVAFLLIFQGFDALATATLQGLLKIFAGSYLAIETWQRKLSQRRGSIRPSLLAKALRPLADRALRWA